MFEPAEIGPGALYSTSGFPALAAKFGSGGKPSFLARLAGCPETSPPRGDTLSCGTHLAGSASPSGSAAGRTCLVAGEEVS